MIGLKNSDKTTKVRFGTNFNKYKKCSALRRSIKKFVL